MSRQQKQQQQQDLLASLRGNAQFDQLSKMIVNELLERLKAMIAGQMSDATPQMQQQALMEQIQAVLNGTGGGTGALSAGETGFVGINGVAEPQNGAMIRDDRWAGAGNGMGSVVDGNFCDNGGKYGESLYQMFEQNNPAPPALPSKRDELAPIGEATSEVQAAPPLDAGSVQSAANAASAAPEVVVAANDDEAETPKAGETEDAEEPLRLPIFSQLTQ